MLIHLSIDSTEPLTGTAAAGTRPPIPFVGWLDLLRAISSVVVDDCSQDSPSLAEHEAATEPPPGGRNLS